MKAANRGYTVGDTVQEIVELRPPQPAWQPRVMRGAGVAISLAACLCIGFFGVYRPNFAPYASVRLQINPDVEMTLSRSERVLGLEACNPDGAALLEGYDYAGKQAQQVAAELVGRARQQGYEAEAVAITVTGGSEDWQQAEEETLTTRLQEEYGETIVIHLGEMPEPTRRSRPQRLRLCPPLRRPPFPHRPRNGTTMMTTMMTTIGKTMIGMTMIWKMMRTMMTMGTTERGA